MAQERTFFIVDGSSYIYRAFYALGRLTDSRGLPTQAVYGFAQMLLKVIREKQPAYVCVVFDPPGPTFRHEEYPAYKATRQKMPEDLAIQVPLIKDFVKYSGIPQLEMEGFEADDVIATLCRLAKEHDLNVVIVSGDKDLYQLIEDPGIVQWDPQRDRVYGEREVLERFGVTCRQFQDYLALVGDSSDNVPGVKGVGEKSAKQLIERWGSLDAIYGSLTHVTPLSLRQKLETHRDTAYLSKRLIALTENLSVPFSLDRFEPQPPAREELIRFYEKHAFKSLREALVKERGEIPQASSSGNLRKSLKIKIIRNLDELVEAIGGLRKEEAFSICLVKDSRNLPEARIRGIALSWGNDSACFVPLSSSQPETDGTRAPGDWALQTLEPLLNNSGRGKIGHDLKQDWVILKRHGIRLEGIHFDTMVASYLLDPGKGDHALEKITAEQLGESLGSGGKVIEKGGEVREDPELETRHAAEQACARAEAIFRLTPVIRQKLQETNQEPLFESLELPLIETLAEMESTGILVDADRLQTLTRDFEKALERKASVIFELAKEEFNIQSPRQLAAILFDKLGLPVIKKTKSGPSTDMSVLEELALQHPIAEHVISHRSIAKLKGTYADALPLLINPRTGRIHTSYNQTVTATGRLSSSDPNLQNIPIRTEEGRRIRKAFISAPGRVLLSADYSQIELRILAHFSEDEHLIEAFQAGADVHRRTAAEMLNIAPHEVTHEMRRQAKTINFGIIYGMGPFGLAQRLRITNKMAKAAIERYFDRYRGVRRYIDSIIERTRRLGYTETLLGRRRLIPELQSRNHTVRQLGERLAVNTPIQGTAADLIKKAMIDVRRLLGETAPQTAMLLQVHDELVFEVPEEELEFARNVVKGAMEGVCALKVPLKVEMGWGKNWTEAHP